MGDTVRCCREWFVMDGIASAADDPIKLLIYPAADNSEMLMLDRDKPKQFCRDCGARFTLVGDRVQVGKRVADLETENERLRQLADAWERAAYGQRARASGAEAELEAERRAVELLAGELGADSTCPDSMVCIERIDECRDTSSDAECAACWAAWARRLAAKPPPSEATVGKHLRSGGLTREKLDDMLDADTDREQGANADG